MDSKPFLLFIGLLVACGLEAEQHGNTPKLASLAGTVVVSSRNQPLRDAAVILRAEKNGDTANQLMYSVTTQEDGTFLLADIVPGTYSISAERAGYVPSTKPLAVRRLTLVSGDSLRDLVLPMLETGVITGRVLDKEGDPISRVRVRVSQRSFRNNFDFTAADETNDMGEYRVYHLAPGNYYILADLRNNDATTPKNEKGHSRLVWVPTFYPETTDSSRAVALPVRSGEETRVDLTMMQSKTYSIRGRVQSQRPDVSIFVWRREEIGFEARTVNVRATGDFEINNLSPGTYHILASVGDGSDAITAEIQVKIVDSDVDAVRLSLNAARLKLQGRLIVQGDRPSDLEGLTVILQPEDTEDNGENIATGARQHVTRINSDGSFTVENMFPAVYRVFVLPMANNFQPFFVKSVQFGGKEARENVALTGPSVERLTIIVSTAVQVIEGLVVDERGKTVSNASVVALPEDQDGPDVSRNSQFTDQYGRFFLAHVPPGDYILLAFEGIGEEQSLDPEFLERHRSKGSKFQAREHGRDRVKLNVIALPKQ